MSEIFETADLAAAEQVLSRNYGRLRISAHGQRRGMRLAHASLTPAVRLDKVSFAMSIDAHAAPLGVLIFNDLKAGAVRHGFRGGDRCYRAGQVYLAGQPDHPYAATIEAAETEMAIIDPALPGQVAGTEPGRAQQPVRFTGYEPVSAQAAQAWRDTYAYVRDTVLGLPGTDGHELIVAAAARLLVATALAVFPNNALTDPTVADRHDDHPATLRRAIAFIEANPHRDISLADIAAAANVTIRAVQLAFARHLGVTPVAYLRRVRLAHAHRDLIAADPARHTVTTVAHRWGFHSPSRFAALYRQAYGVTPGRTLSQR